MPVDSYKKNKPSILCVDDTPMNLKLLVELLSGNYQVKVASDGAKALQVLETTDVDLILLDIMMPVMDGIEACKRIRENPKTQDIPILFITAKNQPEDEEKALSVGGNDFIAKPINPGVLFARVETQIKLFFAQKELKAHNQNLEEQVEKRLSEVQKLQDSSIFVMVSLAEFRDENTGNHIKRTQLYVKLLAETVSQLPEYRPYLGQEQISYIVKSSPLHDVGKIAIPDSILLKPGKLTEEEFSAMKEHAQKGFDILQRASDAMGEQGEFLKVAQDIALSHHEKWDGSGYPQGLAGKNIPLSARLMAIADVYDALMSARPYKEALPQEKVFEIMKEGQGKHFDPVLLEEFFKLSGELQEVASQFPD